MFKPIDLAKALGAAIIIMVVNVALSFVVVAIYSYLINPGHDEAYYQAAAEWLVPASAVVAGFFLFLGAGYLFAKRKQERNAALFALAIWGGYVLIEFITLVGMDSLTSMIGIISASLGTKLVAVVAGAKLGAR